MRCWVVGFALLAGCAAPEATITWDKALPSEAPAGYVYDESSPHYPSFKSTCGVETNPGEGNPNPYIGGHGALWMGADEPDRAQYGLIVDDPYAGARVYLMVAQFADADTASYSAQAVLECHATNRHVVLGGLVFSGGTEGDRGGDVVDEQAARWLAAGGLDVCA